MKQEELYHLYVLKGLFLFFQLHIYKYIKLFTRAAMLRLNIFINN